MVLKLIAEILEGELVGPNLLSSRTRGVFRDSMGLFARSDERKHVAHPEPRARTTPLRMKKGSRFFETARPLPTKRANRDANDRDQPSSAAGRHAAIAVQLSSAHGQTWFTPIRRLKLARRSLIASLTGQLGVSDIEQIRGTRGPS